MLMSVLPRVGHSLSLDWCVALCLCGTQDLRDAGIVTMLMSVLPRVGHSLFFCCGESTPPAAQRDVFRH
jgi:hypothetical protein